MTAPTRSAVTRRWPRRLDGRAAIDAWAAERRAALSAAVEREPSPPVPVDRELAA
jgi:hypothetical protein